MLPQRIVEDDRLSCEEMGVLVYLLSRPDDWKIQPKQLQDRFAVGRDKLRGILDKLIEYGYARVEQVKKDGKFSYNNWYIFEGSLGTGSPFTENPQLTNYLSLPNTNNINGVVDNCPYGDIMESYQQNCPNLRGVIMLNSKRKRNIRRVWEMDERHQRTEFWDMYFEHCNGVPFYQGVNDRGWKADIEYLTREEVFTKNIERFSEVSL